MFQTVFYVVLSVSGQFSFELPPAGDTGTPPQFFENAEPPAASLQAPAQFSDSRRSASQLPTSETPLSPVSSDVVESAATLLRGVLGGTGERPLEGQGVTLAEVLTGAASGEQRVRATRMYWQLAKLAAEHRFCVEETNFLSGLAVPQAAHQQAVLASAQASAKAEEARTRLAALRSQHQLAAVGARTEAVSLPLPADLPFVGVYETRFDSFQARGLAVESLARIHATLPLQREVLQRQADAVYAADTALRELQQGYQAGQVPLGNVLDGFAQLQRQRRALLTSVLEYNESIAEYAFAVASPHLPVDRLVGMLIETSDGQRSVLATRRDNGTIRRASNEEPIDHPPQGRPQH
jgi:hypothetical protein